MIRSAVPILLSAILGSAPGSRTVPRRHAGPADADDSGDDRGGGRAPRTADAEFLYKRAWEANLRLNPDAEDGPRRLRANASSGGTLVPRGIYDERRKRIWTRRRRTWRGSLRRARAVKTCAHRAYRTGHP